MATMVEANKIVFKTNNAEVEKYWSNGTTLLAEWRAKTYNKADEVKVTSENTKYKFSGTNGSSSSNTPSQEPHQWVSSPLNPIAILAYDNSIQTQRQESLDFSFDARNIDTIALFNVEAQEVSVKCKNNLVTTELISNTSENEFSHTLRAVPFAGFV